MTSGAAARVSHANVASGESRAAKSGNSRIVTPSAKFAAVAG